jgi:hypothetical protein
LVLGNQVLDDIHVPRLPNRSVLLAGHVSANASAEQRTTGEVPAQ